MSIPGLDSNRQQFLANVSHELRTPMNAIMGMVDLALGEELSSHVRDYLQTARDSSRVMLSLVDDLLDFSRMEAGRFELEMDPFSIRRVLDSAMRALSLRAFETGLELTCEVAPDVPDYLIGDGRRFRQVISNLVGNAIKFTERGEVACRVDLDHRQKEHALVAVSVRDTGIGIAPGDLERIFRPFEQGDGSVTRRHSGVGLGLSICRQIVDQMQGAIRVDSHLGVGSTFSATLRFGILSQRPNFDLHAIEQLESLPVLVVDDNATNRRILADTLVGWSMRPATATGAEAAVDMIARAEREGHPYPLLIVDGAMPHTDGWTLIRLLEERGLIGHARILMLSSGGRRAVGNQVETLPISAFLEKPVSQSMLLDAIMTVLNGPPQRRDDVTGIQKTTHPLSILVAEDTPANRKVVDAILERRGHDCELVSNGRQAVEMFESRNYDAVLMDVQMPVMDGLQATAAIRASDKGRTVPIIAMTAHAMRGDRERCLRAGMNAYVPKPLVADDLLNVLEQAVARARQSWKVTDSMQNSSAARSHAADTSPAQNADAAINLNIARQRLGNDERLLKDMAGFYQEDAPQLLQELQTALAKSDAETSSRAAHSLKGLSSNFEAVAAAKLAQTMEDATRNQRFNEARSLLPELINAIGRVSEALVEELR
jgi:CheY-like chemotaxis protein/HPt (histidine-containing phosphotransfer) domain-containing protein